MPPSSTRFPRASRAVRPFLCCAVFGKRSRWHRREQRSLSDRAPRLRKTRNEPLRMRPWLKRTLQITGGVVLLVAAGFGGIVYSIIGGNTEITDGATPPPAVRIIKDGFVGATPAACGVVDVGARHVFLIAADY